MRQRFLKVGFILFHALESEQHNTKFVVNDNTKNGMYERHVGYCIPERVLR